MGARRLATLAQVSATKAALTFAIVVICLTLYYANAEIPAGFRVRLRTTISLAYAGTFLFLTSTILSISALYKRRSILEMIALILLITGILCLFAGLFILISPTIDVNPLP